MKIKAKIKTSPIKRGSVKRRRPDIKKLRKIGKKQFTKIEI